jgi:hypothetical protein
MCSDISLHTDTEENTHKKETKKNIIWEGEQCERGNNSVLHFSFCCCFYSCSFLPIINYEYLSYPLYNWTCTRNLHDNAVKITIKNTFTMPAHLLLVFQMFFSHCASLWAYIRVGHCIGLPTQILVGFNSLSLSLSLLHTVHISNQ